LSFRSIAALLATAALCTAACGESSAELFAGDNSPSVQDDGADAGLRTSLAEDSAAAPVNAYRGNPLCRVMPTTCMPDEDGYKNDLKSAECTPQIGDGGADAAVATVACRVTRADDGLVAPACLTATRTGFDCVEGEKGSACRRYCCLGTCSGQTSQNGGATFCDVQKLVDANQKAPVCVPLKRCKLLVPGECEANETCGVVDENGDTGCVGIGPAQVGQDCDETHCATALTCLGQPGNRKCYQLCKVGSTTCASGQVCKTSALFKDMSFGVCHTP
jgi:hypothetical protein